VYLEELEHPTTVGVGLIRLVVAKPQAAPQQAQALIALARRQYLEVLPLKGILELIETVMVYKFPTLSREEIEAMLKLDGLKETRVYQEALQEGKLAGREEGKLEAVPALLARGFSVEEIAQILGLSVAQVAQGRTF